MNTMIPTLHFGAFNAEAFLDDDSYVQLPSFPDVQAEKIVHSMDELLFPLCADNDILLTRYAIQQCQKQYLESIAIRTETNTESIDANFSTESTLLSLLSDKKNRERFQSFFTKAVRISPYAHIPEMDKFYECCNIKYEGPGIQTVKKVNSKIYSHSLHDILGIKRYSEMVTTISEMEKARLKFADRKFLIKYPLGVSGKGNVLINSEKMFHRILKHCSAQIDKGKRLEMLMEPYLDKLIDFSCQMKIESDGRFKILSVQKMENNNFAYSGSSCADRNLYALLEQKGYFTVMQSVARQLFADGYFGNVCVDSMLLKDDTIVPIVEINARKSMGLINHYINEYFEKYNLKSNLRFYSVGINTMFSYQAMLKNMENGELLFQADERSGILPLSSNAVTINRDADINNTDNGKVYKGRLYFSIGARNTEKMNELLQGFRTLLGAMNMTVYN
jgi:hypothetical protein